MQGVSIADGWRDADIQTIIGLIGRDRSGCSGPRSIAAGRVWGNSARPAVNPGSISGISG